MLRDQASRASLLKMLLPYSMPSWKYVCGELWRESSLFICIKKEALGHLYPSPENTSKTAENGPVILKTLQVNVDAPDNQALVYTAVFYQRALETLPELVISHFHFSPEKNRPSSGTAQIKENGLFQTAL